MNNVFYELNDEKLQELMLFKNNPGQTIEYAYRLLYELTNGRVNVPDPTTPFSYALEMSAVQAASLHQAHEANYRAQYPKLATKYSHLYNHMFDEHYIGRFATPGRCRFDIYFKRDELMNALVYDANAKTRKLIIPRGSFVAVMDYAFTFLYSIRIEQLSHGGIHVLYETSKKDPLQTLTTNMVPWDYVVINNEEYLRIRPTLMNVTISSYNDSLSQTSGYANTYEVRNKFCYFRGYYRRLESNETKEFTTTHSDLVYDHLKPTAKLTYLIDKLRIEVPSLYFNQNLVDGQAYWEIYTTSGKVEESLEEYGPDSFTAQWGVLDNTIDDLKYVEPIKLITSPIIQASSMFTGGTDGESFEETRDRVINFANYDKTPITHNQLKTELRFNGYNIVKSKDNITSRTYLATKPLPINKYDEFTSGASNAMETFLTTINDLVTYPEYVRDNGRRVTITPNMLFKSNGGQLSVVSKEDRPTREKLGLDEFINTVNSLTYSFIPFHYVLDPTNDSFNMRAYYFNEPKIVSQTFINNNVTSGYSVSTVNTTLFRYEEEVDGVIKEGFKFRIQTDGTEAYKTLNEENLFAQLHIKPHHEKDFACIQGKYLGVASLEDDNQDEVLQYFWEFDLPTSWDITDEHMLVVKNMYMHDTIPRKYDVPLKGEFFIVHGVKNEINPNHEVNEVDAMINNQPMENENHLVGITLEKFEYHLGDHLSKLWSNGIPVQSAYEYERHEEDIPRVYTHDVYDIEPDGNFVLSEDNLVIKHHAGDIVKEPDIDPVTGKQKRNAEGELLFKPVLFAHKGDIKIDRNGNPVIAKSRDLAYLLDLFVVDGIYYFATDENDVHYRNLIANSIRDRVMNELNEISDKLLENTRLYYYPQRTMGNATIIVNEGKEIEVPMRASFKVTFYMPENTYQDNGLRQVITRKTKEIINHALTAPRVAISEITQKLEEMGGEDIVAVEMANFKEGDFTFSVYTSKEPDVRRSVKRVLEARPDNTIKVIEDIDVIFLKHETAEELKA